VARSRGVEVHHLDIGSPAGVTLYEFDDLKVVPLLISSDVERLGVILVLVELRLYRVEDVEGGGRSSFQ